jgi:hypothetical protein
MALKDDVQIFLNNFKIKGKTFGISYYQRKKNTDALLQSEDLIIYPLR